MRINKFLAQSGIASRRFADKLISDGIVKINGKTCSLGDEVKGEDIIAVNGQTVKKKVKYEYYIMNKPKGYICTVKDEKGRKTVMDLLPNKTERLFPVGRLDYDTEGLLLFTNDGELTYRLTHPKNEIPKTYLVKTEKPVSEEMLNKLRGGIYIDGVKTNKCKIKIVESSKTYSKLHVTITEGKNRQVRKMFDFINSPVDFLKRIKIGDLTLSGLNRGECRKLTFEEIDYLKNL